MRRTWTDTFVRPKQWKRDLNGIWYMKCKETVWSGSLRAAPRYKLDLRGVQEVSSQKGDTVRVDYNFLYGKGNGNHKLGTGFFTPHNSVSS